MFLKSLGFIFAVVGGILIGIGLMSDSAMSMWWWFLTLLFLCVGLMGVFFSTERGAEE